MQMDVKSLSAILEKHQKWLRGEPDGEVANLYGADLCNADLRGADLRGAYLRGANLCNADLRGANLCNADLREANLCDTDLYGADLSRAILYGAILYGATLCGANLRGANLRGANLRGANLRGAKNIDLVRFNENTAFFALQCPEKGSYTAYKKARGLIVELAIPADALRSSATSRKCRASKARVISITTEDGKPAGNQVPSDRYGFFIYTVGEMVEVPDFDTDRWNECSTGIHHFITRAEAVNYK